MLKATIMSCMTLTSRTTSKVSVEEVYEECPSNAVCGVQVIQARTNFVLVLTTLIKQTHFSVLGSDFTVC